MTCSKQCPDSSVGLGFKKKKKKLFLLSLLLWSLEVGQDLQHLIGQILVRLEYNLLIDEVLSKSLGPE